MNAEAIDFSAPPAPAGPTLQSVPPVPGTYVPLVLCVCGHEADAHEHHRRGDDCGVCGSVRCRGFRRRTGRGARSLFRR